LAPVARRCRSPSGGGITRMDTTIFVPRPSKALRGEGGVLAQVRRGRRGVVDSGYPWTGCAGV
jgi:hypothetical protein